jgi:hypothetical protein
MTFVCTIVAAHPVCSPPPCGEGLGVGVTVADAAFNPPPPRRLRSAKSSTLPARGRVQKEEGAR